MNARMPPAVGALPYQPKAMAKKVPVPLAQMLRCEENDVDDATGTDVTNTDEEGMKPRGPFRSQPLSSGSQHWAHKNKVMKSEGSERVIYMVG